MTEDYLKKFQEEADKITMSYHEAVKLGQAERAKAISNKIYNSGFRHYKLICKQIRMTEQEMKKQTDPKLKEVLSDFIEISKSNAEKLAQHLDEFISQFFSL